MTKENMEMEYEDFETIYLTLDDDSELECAVLTEFMMEEKKYMALLPLEEDSDEEEGVLLYRYEDKNDKEIELFMIEDEEEFDKAAEVYYDITSHDHDHDEDGNCIVE